MSAAASITIRRDDVKTAKNKVESRGSFPTSRIHAPPPPPTSTAITSTTRPAVIAKTMTPQQRQERALTATASFGLKKRGTLSFRSSAALPLTLVFNLGLLLSSAPVASGTSSSSSLGLCIGKAQACSFDDVCNECLGSWSLDNVDDECVVGFEEGSSTTTGDCGTAGIETCCGFEPGTAPTCMQNTLMVEYWACIQSGNGCDLDDIPCYGTDDDDTAEASEEDTSEAVEEIQPAGSGAVGITPCFSGLVLAGFCGAVTVLALT
eukprot:jgi/Undpi1/2367/HiC_scaffold_13.g05750.m1